MRVVVLIGFLVVVFCAVTTAESMASKEKAGDPIEGCYIVKVKAGLNSEDVIKTLTDSFSTSKVTRRYSAALNGFAAELPPEAVTFLEGLDAVEYVEQDQVVSIQPIGVS